MTDRVEAQRLVDELHVVEIGLRDNADACDDLNLVAVADVLMRATQTLLGLLAQLDALSTENAALKRWQSRCSNCERLANPENEHCDECCPAPALAARLAALEQERDK